MGPLQAIKFCTFLFLLFRSVSKEVEGARILFLVPISSRSEADFFEPIISKLGSDGHSVTVVMSSKLQTPHPNVTEFVPITSHELFKDFSDISMYSNILGQYLIDMRSFAPFVSVADRLYMNPGFREIVLEQKYDLVFCNIFFADGFYGYFHKNGAPFILIHSIPTTNYFLKELGYHSPPSFVPNPLIEYTDKMSFMQRLRNFIVDWWAYIHYTYYYAPMMESVYRKHLGDDTPSISEIKKNVSLTMMNSHFTSTYHRPIMQDVVEIGGAHCRPPKRLPKDIEDFVNHPDGFIVVSFGTILHGSSLQEEMRLNLLNVFSKLKQRVIWKWESETMDDLPKNVMLKKWLPQQDLLGHKNAKFFITHAGLLSTQQGIYHGVPLLLFPTIFDQNTNANYVVDQGFGIRLELFSSSQQDIEVAVQKLLTEPTYQEKANEVSAIFRDQAQSPLDRAVFWTNHVLKFKGAPHLRSYARELSLFERDSLDVIVFIVVLTTIVALILGFALIKLSAFLVHLPTKEKVL